VSTTSLEVYPRWRKRPSSPTLSATDDTNAMTSCFTCASISCMRATFTRAPARSFFAASRGTSPRSASTSTSASSISSHCPSRDSSVQIFAIAGRV
jgi:hypothetical protein